MNDKKDEKYEPVSQELNQILRNNIQQLIDEHGYSQSQFFELLASKKVCVTRSYLNQIMKSKVKTIPLAFLLSCCDFFGISVNDLVSPTFNAKSVIYNPDNVHKDYLDIQDLLKRRRERQQNTSQKGTESKMEQSSIVLPLSNLNSNNLVTDPSNILFNGYIQKYYCYYYPTDSSESKKDNSILKGILKLKKMDNFCQSTLTIDTNTKDDIGNTNYKEYTGYAAISPTVNSMNCIMYSDFLCEFCFVMFRHFNLNFNRLDCRIAEVLSSSSAAEDRRPTVLRMLLSREPISDDDLQLIAPAFLLNYSTIAVNKKHILEMEQTSDKYREIIEDLLNIYDTQEVFFYKETDIFKVANQYLDNKAKSLEFIMQLRAISYSYKYNKIGSKADDSVREILLSRGYYKPHQSSGKEKN